MKQESDSIMKLKTFRSVLGKAATKAVRLTRAKNVEQLGAFKFTNQTYTLQAQGLVEKVISPKTDAWKILLNIL